MTTFPFDEDLTANPDRVRWNSRHHEHSLTGTPLIRPSDLLDQAMALTPPAGPVLDLAGGPSGMALALAEAGRQVTVVDISDEALTQLATQAQAHGVADRLTLVHADLTTWTAQDHTRYAVVLCRLFWDADVFHRACRWVATGGVLAWEGLAVDAHDAPHSSARWRLKPGEPAALLPLGFAVVAEADLQHHGEPVRRMIAVRAANPANTRM